MNRRRLSTVVGAGVLAVSLALTVTVTTALSGTAAPSTATPTCAWPLKVGADATNVYLPDSNAVYWWMPYPVSDDLQITVSGSYPDSRYMSVSAYDSTNSTFTSNGVSSSLSDSAIAPEAGSVNPWQQPADPGGKYTVTARMDAAPGDANTLPLAPTGTAAGTQGSLEYRVYLPAGSDFDDLVLPTVTLTQDGTSTTLPPCTGSSAGTSRAGADLRPATDGSDVFVRAAGQGAGLAANADNAYLSAEVTPPGPDDVLVIRAKAPHAVPGNHPVPWPAHGADMRYWSLCTNLETANYPVVVNKLPDGSTDYGCRYDGNTRLDPDGYYTFALGTEDQRAAIEQNPWVTFVPLSTSQPNATHLVLLRNLLSVDSFPHAVQDVAPGTTAAQAHDVMGDYYPELSTWSLDTLKHWRPHGCH